MPEQDNPIGPAGGGKPKTETVTLKKEHKHRGELKQPGETIDVTADQKKRLQQHGEI